MDVRRLDNLLSGRSAGVGAAAARGALAVAAAPYAGTMALRRWAYRTGILPSASAAAPVICVGNITTGGTGKTPMVALVVGHLRQMGRSPAILTRGYKAVGGVSDEAELLKQLCSGAGEAPVPVIVDADRVAGAARACAAGADVLVMDDGFQHLRLRRQLDIVLIDATNPWGHGHTLPRGLLREPLGALRQAGAVVLTRCERVDSSRVAELAARLRTLAPHAAHAQATYAPRWLVAADGQRCPMEWLAGKRVLAFCGIGNPRAFLEAVASCGAELVGERALPDHVAYDTSLLDELRQQALHAGAEALVTTPKDMVKLRGASLPMPLLAVTAEMRIVEGLDALLGRIRLACGLD